MAKPPLYHRLNELILTFGYCGKSRFAPGTVGSIGAMLCWYFANNYFIANNFPLWLQSFFWIIIIFSLTIFSCYSIKHYQIFLNKSNIDDKSIVVDEAIGIFIALELFKLYLGNQIFIIDPLKYIIYILAGFLLFRFFDIKKPWIIGICDRTLKNSFGVLLDDILCGLIAGIFTIILYKYTHNTIWFQQINCSY